MAGFIGRLFLPFCFFSLIASSTSTAKSTYKTKKEFLIAYYREKGRRRDGEGNFLCAKQLKFLENCDNKQKQKKHKAFLVFVVETCRTPFPIKIDILWKSAIKSFSLTKALRMRSVQTNEFVNSKETP